MEEGEPEPVCGISQEEFFKRLISVGIPGNDASLIGYGALKKKSFTWQNDQSVSESAVISTNDFLEKIDAGIKVSTTPAKWGRVVWEVTVVKK